MAEKQSDGGDLERYVSQSRLAGIKGKSRQAIGKAVSEGKLILHGKGRAARIDLEHPLTIAYLAAPSNPGKATVPTPSGAQRKPAKKKAAPPAPAPPPTVPTAENVPPASPENIRAAEAYMDKQEIERLNKLQATKKLELHNATTRGDLIERETVQSFIHLLHEIDNSQLKTLGFKVSSDIAAVFGSDDAAKVKETCGLIDAGVMQILKQIKREANKFLKKMGAGKIPKAKAARIYIDPPHH